MIQEPSPRNPLLVSQHEELKELLRDSEMGSRTGRLQRDIALAYLPWHSLARIAKAMDEAASFSACHNRDALHIMFCPRKFKERLLVCLARHGPDPVPPNPHTGGYREPADA